MKKVLIAVAAVFALVLTGAAIAIFISERDEAVIVKYARNENLPTIKSDWKGTQVDAQNRFVNYEFAFLPKISDMLKWQFSANPQKEEKETDAERLKVLNPTEFLQGERDGILWLGHAGFFIRLGGKNILIDAVFGKPPFVKTFVDVPSPIEEIERVDLVLISHDHRDHADEETVRQITRKFPEAQILAGLGTEDLLNDWKTPTNKLQTAGWFQQFLLPDENIKIYFLPTRHWSRRALFDTNKRLWGAFVIQSGERTIYFGGDSGYGSHYKELAALFPKIDFAILGVGAYKPRWFMQPNHNSPDDAMQSFIDSNAGNFIPMHFGRFDLSDEPPGEPLRLLDEKAKELNLTNKIKVLQINESLEF
jgi:L-ascorbate metabolism protein UlaG (beta-lactamase superfamily)